MRPKKPTGPTAPDNGDKDDFYTDDGDLPEFDAAEAESSNAPFAGLEDVEAELGLPQPGADEAGLIEAEEELEADEGEGEDVEPGEDEFEEIEEDELEVGAAALAEMPDDSV